MKISVFYDHILEASEQTCLSAGRLLLEAAAKGIRGVEINLTMLLEHREEILSDIREAGMEISCIYEFYDFGNDPDLSKGQKHIETAKETGAKRILIVPGMVPENEAERLAAMKEDYAKLSEAMRENKQIGRMCGCLKKLVEAAKHADPQLKVSLEDFDGTGAPYRLANELRYFMEQVPGLGFTIDCGNFVFSDEDAWAGYQMLKPYVVHCHCKDRGVEAWSENGSLPYRFNRGMACVPAGGGYMPVKEIVLDLIADGYDGYFAIEHFGAPDQLRFMESSARYLLSLQPEK